MCALSSLDERPAVLPAENVPRVPVVRVVGYGGALLGGKRVVVVVHDHTEVLVIDNTRATGSEYLAVAGEEHGAAGLLAGLSIGINLEDKNVRKSVFVRMDERIGKHTKSPRPVEDRQTRMWYSAPSAGNVFVYLPAIPAE